MNRMTYCIAMALLCGLAANTQAQQPYAAPDDSWISISGTVQDPSAGSFTLDYGDGTITVEMDDWDWYAEGYQVLEGDGVTVYGRVDDDLFELATIEANSVYVEDLNSFFYASALDEEDPPAVMVAHIVEPAGLVLQGEVEDVNGREFTVRTGSSIVTVDTSTMPYDPTDDDGYQQIEAGDVVRVLGHIDVDLFEEREIIADVVITLTPDTTN